MQNTVGQQYKPTHQASQQPAIQQPVVQQCVPQQTQNIPVPNYSGVNIQIFNPSVGVPGGAPVYNVNAPQYQTSPNCYPSGYYTNQWGNPNSTANNTNNNTATSKSTSTTTTTTTKTEEKKKTEKRNIVQLTDDYIRNLENYLNSQDKEIRFMGAKEVAARLQEDDSRKNDKALTALVNKMLQDPYQPVRLLALSLLDARAVIGDDFTVGLLQQMQHSDSGYGQDALQASQILLKMSGQIVQKEFEVKDKPQKEAKK